MAQPNSAAGSYPAGCRFESGRGRQFCPGSSAWKSVRLRTERARVQLLPGAPSLSALVAQSNRVRASEARGRRFESGPGRQSLHEWWNGQTHRLERAARKRCGFDSRLVHQLWRSSPSGRARGCEPRRHRFDSGRSPQFWWSAGVRLNGARLKREGPIGAREFESCLHRHSIPGSSNWQDCGF